MALTGIFLGVKVRDPSGLHSVRIIAQAVRRESEVKLTFRLNVVGKTPNRGEVCVSLREWREVE
jgi:hypothetical protein